MKKNLSLLLLAGAMFISSYNKLNESEQNKYIPLKENIKIFFPEKDSTKEKKNTYINKALDGIEKINEKYLNENTNSISFFNNERKLKDKIIDLLGKKEHALRLDNITYSEHYYQIDELSLKQIKIIYLMIKSLEDSSFSNKVGRIIKEDVEDMYSEHGGIINFKGEANLNLICLESELKKQKKVENNEEYVMPSRAFLLRKIAYFHLHACEYDEILFAGPSLGDIYDLESNSIFFGALHDFVITSVKKGKFNVDYTGIDTTNNQYVKVIDLGNYAYDTAKIEK